MIHTLFVSVRAIENSSDIGHAVHTNCRALEDRTEKIRQIDIYTVNTSSVHSSCSELISSAESDGYWISPTYES